MFVWGSDWGDAMEAENGDQGVAGSVQMMTSEQELRCGKHQSRLEILGGSSRRREQLRIGFPKTCLLHFCCFVTQLCSKIIQN